MEADSINFQQLQQTIRFRHAVLDLANHRNTQGLSVVPKLQPSKAPSPTYVTDSGIVMLSKDLHSLKAPFPMAVTDSGMAMLAKDSQYAKARSPMSVTDLGIVMIAKDLHSSKALSPMAVTD